MKDQIATADEKSEGKQERLGAFVGRMSHHRPVQAEGRVPEKRARLLSIVERLRGHILDDFRLNEHPRFQMMDEIFRKGYGLPVATLSVCGEGTAEVRFTKLLAYFFDSRNPHGLGGLLARAVFADEPGVGMGLPFDACTAEAEVSLGPSKTSKDKTIHNSLDVLITVGDLRILIEQKINSAEGDDQTARYTKAMRSIFGDARTCCFYLTPDGRAARDEAWRALSYRVLFTRLATVLDGDALSVVARHNLKALLWDLMIGPLAQNRRFMTELRQQTQRVAKDVVRYADFNRWFSRYGLFSEERRVLLKIVEA